MTAIHNNRPVDLGLFLLIGGRCVHDTQSSYIKLNYKLVRLSFGVI